MLRLGLGLLNQVKEIEEDWLAIIDHSIGIGTKKALVVLRVVLRVRVAALLERGGAIKLEDCECIGVDVSEKVNGETTADATLNKAFRLVSEKHEGVMYAIDDIGHVLASGLKVDYEKRKTFKDFIAIAAKGSKFLCQTNLSGFSSPKIRTKGRFQSISHLGKWAKKIFNILGIEQLVNRVVT